MCIEKYLSFNFVEIFRKSFAMVIAISLTTHLLDIEQSSETIAL